MSTPAAVAEAAALVPLPRAAYERPVVELATALLGALIISERTGGLVVGRIVETEAYGGPDDRASHARAGVTARTGPMFGTAGHAYVYLVYGMHECLNVVAEAEGIAGAVLLRALEPVRGAELMRARRGRPTDPDARLAAGPARLAQALAVTRADNGHDLTRGQGLWISAAGDAVAHEIASGPRVGVAYAGADWAARPWRFWLRGSASVSRR